MFLWFILALLTGGAVLAVLWPFLRPPATAAAGRAHDAAVYRDQLAEIDADQARGLIDKAEAQSARTEISRRILATGEAGGPGKSKSSQGAARLAFAFTVVCLPIASLAIYLSAGNPSLPDQPLAARLESNETNQSIAALVAKVEARLREHPDDGKGWDVVAPVYLRLGRYGDAADAFEQAIRLLGASAARYSGYGEALVADNSGIVSEKAREAFAKARHLDPQLLKPRFWIGMSQEQDGKWDDAAATWRELLSSPDERAPWRPMVQERLKQAEAKLASSSATPNAAQPKEAAPGPSAEDVAAASRMSAGDRREMIEQMVSGLAERLKQQGGSVEEWARLVRSYVVLDRKEDAVAALAQARKSFDGDEAAQTKLTELAKGLGI